MRRHKGRTSNQGNTKYFILLGVFDFSRPTFNFVCNNSKPGFFFFCRQTRVCQICGHRSELQTQIAIHHAGSASNRITDTVSAGRNHTDLILRWLGVSHVVAQTSRPYTPD